jgi:chromosome segregation ATPase
LEEECRELQQSVDVEGGASANTMAELQESNQRLLAEVREARAEHDEAHAPLITMEADVKNLRSRLEFSDVELEDIQLQISEGVGRNIQWKEEVEVLRAQLASVEQRAKDFEEENQTWKRRQQEASENYRRMREHVLRLDQSCLELDGKLQNSLTKLEKQKPEEPLSRCLRYSRPREKWSNALRLRPRDRLGGSDAGSESIDADVSTTCGESAVDMDLGQIGV